MIKLCLHLFSAALIRCVVLIGTTALMATPAAWAYDAHDLRQVLRTTSGPKGPVHALDIAAVDAIVADLSRHAANYPPRFANAKERQVATEDARKLSGMLDILISSSSGAQVPTPSLLLSVARLNAVAHNLDVPAAGKRADAAYRQLLAQVPDHPQGNYGFGLFLASTARAKMAIPYLDKAMKLGVDAAAYTLGMAYLSLDDKENALRLMERYAKTHPSDSSVRTLVDVIKQGGR